MTYDGEEGKKEIERTQDKGEKLPKSLIVTKTEGKKKKQKKTFKKRQKENLA